MAYIGRDTDKISNVEVLDNITFDGSSSYTLQKGGSNFTPSSANTLLLSIDGVVQAGNFTVSGSTIDFGTAVAGTSTCDFVLHYGVGLITTPSDGTVTTAKLADSSVSLAKLTATGTKDATTFLRGDNSFQTVSSYADSDALSLFNASGSAPVYACRAWVSFDQTGTQTINASGNVSSLTDNGSGDTNVNFATNMSDTNYCVSLSLGKGLLSTANQRFPITVPNPASTSYFEVASRLCDNDNNTFINTEANGIYVSIFR
jgi:hypothetical protein